jgi:DNA helicase MCM9
MTRWTAERLWRASYHELGSPAEVQQRFKNHLLSLSSCRKAVQNLLTSAESRNSRDYSLEIDAFEILEADPVLGHLLLKYPNTLVPVLEKAIVEAQKDLKQQLEDEQQRDAENEVESSQEGGTPIPQNLASRLTVKGEKGTRVHGRIFHLPPTCCRTSIAAMEATDVGKIIQLSGTCVRTSPVQMYESARTYKCTGKKGCGRTFVQYADLEERNNAMATPDRCILFNDQGVRCGGTNLQLQVNESVHTDYQEIKIQEQASKLSVGNIPRSLLIKLQHDLVDTCHPGD